MHFKLPYFLLSIFPIISLCFYQAISQNLIQGARGEQEIGNLSLIIIKTCSSSGKNSSLATEIPEFENELLGNIQRNFQTGVIELLKIVNSLNKTLAAQKEEISAMKEENKLIRKLNNLDTELSWEDFDELIQTKSTGIQIGNSFNGSTLSDIKSRAAEFGREGSYCAVVFVNHLDEAITDFKIFDTFGKTYHPAPNVIPPHMEEIFTLAKADGYSTWVSFSYAIPSRKIRVGAMAFAGAIGAGLAFLPEGADMKKYYESRNGIPGSSVYDSQENTDKNLSVAYKNIFARMFVDDEGFRKSTYRIELIDLPLDD